MIGILITIYDEKSKIKFKNIEVISGGKEHPVICSCSKEEIPSNMNDIVVTSPQPSVAETIITEAIITETTEYTTDENNWSYDEDSSIISGDCNGVVYNMRILNSALNMYRVHFDYEDYSEGDYTLGSDGIYRRDIPDWYDVDSPLLQFYEGANFKELGETTISSLITYRDSIKYTDIDTIENIETLTEYYGYNYYPFAVSYVLHHDDNFLGKITNTDTGRVLDFPIDLHYLRTQCDGIPVSTCCMTKDTLAWDEDIKGRIFSDMCNSFTDDKVIVIFPVIKNLEILEIEKSDLNAFISVNKENKDNKNF